MQHGKKIFGKYNHPGLLPPLLTQRLVSILAKRSEVGIFYKTKRDNFNDFS